MVSHLFFSQLALIALMGLLVMLLYVWPSDHVRRSTPAAPLVPRRQHTTESKPFAGLTTKPSCALGEKESAVLHGAPPVRPAPMPPTYRHPRTGVSGSSETKTYGKGATRREHEELPTLPR